MPNRAWRTGVTESMRKVIYERDGGKCAYCKRQLLPFGTSRPGVPQRLHELAHAYAIWRYDIGDFDPAKWEITTPEIVDFIKQSQAARQYVHNQVDNSNEKLRYECEQQLVALLHQQAQDNPKMFSQWERQRTVCQRAWDALSTLEDRLKDEHMPDFPDAWLQEAQKLARERRALLNQLPHVDHITPAIKGGSDDMANLALACSVCNQQKGSMSLTEWTTWKEQHSKYRRASGTYWETVLPFDEALNA